MSFLSEKVLIAQKTAKNVNLDNSKLHNNNNYGKKAARRIEEFYTVHSRDKYSTFPYAKFCFTISWFTQSLSKFNNNLNNMIFFVIYEIQY